MRAPLKVRTDDAVVSIHAVFAMGDEHADERQPEVLFRAPDEHGRMKILRRQRRRVRARHDDAAAA